MREFVVFIADFFVSRYGHIICRDGSNFDSLLVTSACAATKMSFHVVVQNVFVRDRREFCNQMRAHHEDLIVLVQ